MLYVSCSSRISKDIEVTQDITIITVEDTRAALSGLSACFYGKPSEKMELIGVTGTNGKTTTAYFIKSILDNSNHNVGLIGTLGTFIKGKSIRTTHTTPESLELHEIFKSMIDVNIDSCVMEVSSHSIKLERINDCDFNIGIFTNLTHEHLDFHKTIENYYKVKRQLFFTTNRFNIVNIDDSFGNRLAKEVADIGPTLLTYGIENKADISAKEVFLSDNYSQF